MNKNFKLKNKILQIKVSDSNSTRAWGKSQTPDSFLYLFSASKTNIDKYQDIYKYKNKEFSLSVNSTILDRAKIFFKYKKIHNILENNILKYKIQNNIQISFIHRSQNQFSLHIGKPKERGNFEKLYIESLFGGNDSKIIINFRKKEFNIVYVTDGINPEINKHHFKDNIWFSTKKWKSALKDMTLYMYIKYEKINTCDFKNILKDEFMVSKELMNYIYSFQDNSTDYFDHSIRNFRNQLQKSGSITKGDKNDEAYYYSGKKKVVFQAKQIEIFNSFFETAEKFLRIKKSTIKIFPKKNNLDKHSQSKYFDINLLDSFVNKTGRNNSEYELSKKKTLQAMEKAKKTGDDTEDLAFDAVLEIIGEYTNLMKINFDINDICRSNDNERMGADYKIKFEHDILYFEIKKITSFKKISFMLSANEIKVALNNLNNYYFLLVDDEGKIGKAIAKDLLKIIELKPINFSATSRKLEKDRNLSRFFEAYQN